MKNLSIDAEGPKLKEDTGQTTVQPEDLDNAEVSNSNIASADEKVPANEHVTVEYVNPEDLDAVDPEEIKLGEEYL